VCLGDNRGPVRRHRHNERLSRTRRRRHGLGAAARRAKSRGRCACARGRFLGRGAGNARPVLARFRCAAADGATGAFAEGHGAGGRRRGRAGHVAAVGGRDGLQVCLRVGCGVVLPGSGG
jgi:hypothetical protein